MHSKISFFRSPVIWIRLKLKKGFSRPGYYLPGIIPSIIVVLSLIVGLSSFFQFDEHNIIKILIFVGVGYGLISLFLLYSLVRHEIRVKKARDLYENIHVDLIKRLRKYMDYVDKANDLNDDFFQKYIEEFLEAFNKSFLEVFYGKGVVITLKFLCDRKLYPIRYGRNHEHRNQETESINESIIYSLFQDAAPQEYLYIKNLDKLDSFEKKIIGDAALEVIRDRAGDHYKTFITVPVYTNEIFKENLSLDGPKFEIVSSIGLLGIDSKMKYNFGNFDRYELVLLKCLSEILSIIIVDLLKNK